MGENIFVLPGGIVGSKQCDDGGVYITHVNAEGEFETMIGALALELHKSGSEDLTCDVPKKGSQPTPEGNTADYQVEDERLRFTSLESRNRVVSAHVFKEKRDMLSASSNEWITMAHDLWRHEIGRKTVRRADC